MELRYCEECGNGIQVELGKPYSIIDRFVCEPCRQGGPGSRKKDAKPASARLGNLLDADSLNLFSSQTIAIHKQKQESSNAQKPKSSRLRLVKPGSASVVSEAAPAAAPAPGAAAARPGSVRMAAGSATATLSPPAVSDGSANPSRSAQKILFRCLHCRSTLSIRPVERTSKLVCPQCTKEIYVTSSGRLLKSSPSTAIRKDAAGVPEVTGSVRVAKKGSTVQLRAQASPSAAPKPAAPRAAPGSSRIQPLIPGGSVRLTRVHPGSPPPAQKPCSAFEEHQARQDPDKTVFITEEPTEELSRLASTDAMRGVAPKFAKGSGSTVSPSRVAPKEASLLPDEDEAFPGTESFGSGSRVVRKSGLQAESIAPIQDAPPKQTGLAQRVLKALFSP